MAARARRGTAPARARAPPPESEDRIHDFFMEEEAAAVAEEEAGGALGWWEPTAHQWGVHTEASVVARSARIAQAAWLQRGVALAERAAAAGDSRVVRSPTSYMGQEFLLRARVFKQMGHFVETAAGERAWVAAMTPHMTRRGVGSAPASAGRVTPARAGVADPAVYRPVLHRWEGGILWQEVAKLHVNARAPQLSAVTPGVFYMAPPLGPPTIHPSNPIFDIPEIGTIWYNFTISGRPAAIVFESGGAAPLSPPPAAVGRAASVRSPPSTPLLLRRRNYGARRVLTCEYHAVAAFEDVFSWLPPPGDDGSGAVAARRNYVRDLLMSNQQGGGGEGGITLALAESTADWISSSFPILPDNYAAARRALSTPSSSSTPPVILCRCALLPIHLQGTVCLAATHTPGAYSGEYSGKEALAALTMSDWGHPTGVRLLPDVGDAPLPCPPPTAAAGGGGQVVVPSLQGVPLSPSNWELGSLRAACGLELLLRAHGRRIYDAQRDESRAKGTTRFTAVGDPSPALS